MKKGEKIVLKKVDIKNKREQENLKILRTILTNNGKG